MAQKIISCILVLVMLLMLVVSCSEPVDQNDGQGDVTTPVAGATETTPIVDGGETEAPSNDNGNGYIKDEIPADIELEDKTVTFLYWEDASNIEFFARCTVLPKYYR